MPLLLSEFRSSVARWPTVAALRAQGRELSYEDLDRRSAGLAAALRLHGVAPNDIVGLRLPRSPAYVVAMLAVAKVGGIALPLDPSLPEDRLSAIRSAAPPRVEVGFGQPADVLIDLYGDTFEGGGPAGDHVQDPRAPAILSFTSGSTGRPKGVVLSAANVAAGARSWRSDAPTAGARTLMASGPGFILSYIDMAVTLGEGHTLVIADEATRQDPGAMLDLLASEQVTRAFVTVTPTLALAEEALRRPRPLVVEHWMMGAEPLRVSPALRAFGASLPQARFVNTYGSTEAGPVARFVLPPDPADWPATPPIGHAWPGVACAIVDADGALAGPGRAGELVAAGPAVASGYWGDAALTAARFPRDLPGLPEGPAFRIGDLVRREDSGLTHWVGRVDDQIKLAGVRIEPAEVESVLLEHPDLAEAVVAAQPDAAGQPRLVAIVVPRGDARPSAAAMAAHVAARLPRSMVPALWMHAQALPRLPGGKLDRRSLPTVEVHVGGGRAPETPTERAVAACCSELLGLQTIAAEDDIFTLGADSLRAFELATLAASRGLRVGASDLFEGRTIAGIARLIDGRAQDAAGVRLLPLTAHAARAGAREPPLIMVHAVAGMVFNYVPLAQRLPELRCLGLQARGLEPGEMPETDFEAMLASYVQSLRATLPPGPLRIMGYSFGAVVAHGLMRLLRPQPTQEDLLLLIDPVNPAHTCAPAPRNLDDVLAQGLEPTRPLLARMVRPLLPLLPRRMKLALGQDSIRHFLAGAPEALAFQPLSSELVERIVAVWIACAAMQEATRCVAHPVRAALLRAEERETPDWGLGWDALVQVTHTVTLPGNHFTMMAPHHLPGVAAAMRTALGLKPEPA